jgi:hypothetical protein
MSYMASESSGCAESDGRADSLGTARAPLS